jgi:DNA-binding NtrC family response regulator
MTLFSGHSGSARTRHGRDAHVAYEVLIPLPNSLMTAVDPILATQILVVDDTPANLDLLTQVLEGQGYRVLAAPSGEVALRVAARALPDLVLLDVMMGDLDGYETCRRLKADALTRDIPVLFISARDEVLSLIEGFRAGAVDYITKPFREEEVLARVHTHVSLSRLAHELRTKNQELEQRSLELVAANQKLKEEATQRRKAEDALQAADEQLSTYSDREAERWGVAGFIGRSRTISRILDDVRRLQNFGSVNVLISGESGTGKELIARAVHFGSTRAKGPFIPVNCVAIPEELAESILFGHVRGAFTGATMDRKGLFELSDGGTLFLDEIGDMPVTLQAKLLRVLEDGCVTPLGSSRGKQVNVRVVAATNVKIQEQIAVGSFRQDLYFRLAQYTVELPPLRQRREDVPPLAQHFLKLFATEMGIAAPRLEAEALAVLSNYPFPGNVRELKNIIERALIESGGAPVLAEHLRLTTSPTLTILADRPEPAEPQRATVPSDDLPLNLEAAETMLIKRALAETGGNIAEAARRLGVNRTRIYRKLGDADLAGKKLTP